MESDQTQTDSKITPTQKRSRLTKNDIKMARDHFLNETLIKTHFIDETAKGNQINSAMQALYDETGIKVSKSTMYTFKNSSECKTILEKLRSSEALQQKTSPMDAGFQPTASHADSSTE